MYLSIGNQIRLLAPFPNGSDVWRYGFWEGDLAQKER